ncbi:hypothetical protein DOTSEDRAFT_69630 [Dothistroma septosporum NZE10]|uniref:Vps52-domain-containing protein n=1 Tax=Dothistroma septosporum (strain NZE10 / CBS 128990) TaxID=675120 RepID=N1PZE1_DOTSN|nr:hypothetical protein DOTSEDRAFT_69630 [Dothistroma septosporum NZE10]
MSVWLDRFSVQSREPSPSPTSASNRSFSPAPRRSIQVGPRTLQRRPGLQPRSSSLSLASVTGSTDSLPATARIPNGSTLKNQLSQQSAPTNGPIPLEVLESIVGPARHSEGDGDVLESVDATAIAEQIDLAHLSLHGFVHQDIDEYEEASDAKNVKVIQDFEQEKHKFEDLHKSILACDEVLTSVETYLTSFQAELAIVSTEIESLQSRSTALNNKLENRKAVEKILGPEAEAFSISPQMVRKITEGAVDEQWIKSMQELEKRSRFIDAKLKEGRDVKAAQDIQPFITDIFNKAVERIRDYVVAQIKALRSPSINAQVIQQNSFLRRKEIFLFLVKQQPGLAEEISQAYCNTMRWYYLHSFARYKSAVEKLNVHVIDQTDVLAADGGVRRLGKTGPPHDTFCIGRRADVVRSSNNAALPSFAAEEDKGTHYMEVPFRAYNLALIDNASVEYSFLTEFFSEQSFRATNKKFNEIFQPTFELGYALTKQLVEHTLDALGILICVRLTQHFAFELQRRKIAVGEGYINGTNMLLWPRFQQIIDAHCESIRKSTALLSGKPAGSALSLTSSPSTVQTTAPHPLTQRFANFLQGILALSSEAGDDEPVSNSLGRLRSDFEGFLVKLSKGAAEARKRERFLYNNYSLICTIIGETEGKLAEEQRTHFADLRDDLGIDS